MVQFDVREHKEKIILILALIIALFFSKKIWVTHQEKLAKVEKEIGVQKQKISLAAEIKEITKETVGYEKITWKTRESVVIMGRVNELAQKHNIVIYTFDPGAVQRQGEINILAMNLNFSAEYDDLLRFLTELENLPTLTKIKILNLSPQGKQSEERAPTRIYMSILAFIVT